MLTTSILALPYPAQQVIIYSGIPVFIVGVLGGLLNIIIFLSLHTFRESSCAFYLILMSIFNVIVLFTGLLTTIITAISGIDGIDVSLFYCKFRPYLNHVTILSSILCFCLATIDQYWATSSNPRFQQWCDIKLARRLVILGILLWTVHGLPYWFLFYHIQIPNTNKFMCVITDRIYTQYRLYGHLFGFSAVLPFFILILFGLLTYRNIHQISHRSLPITRRDLDKQLMTMVLTQVIVACFLILPYFIVNIFILNPNIINDQAFKYRIDMAYSITTIIFYIYFASPFYIYIYGCERFRRQLIYVLFKIHLNRCQQFRIKTNQVLPHI